MELYFHGLFDIACHRAYSTNNNFFYTFLILTWKWLFQLQDYGFETLSLKRTNKEILEGIISLLYILIKESDLKNKTLLPLTSHLWESNAWFKQRLMINMTCQMFMENLKSNSCVTLMVTLARHNAEASRGYTYHWY